MPPFCEVDFGRAIEGWIGKCSNSNSYEGWAKVGLPEYGPSAIHAETKAYLAPAIRLSGKLTNPAFGQSHLADWKPGMHTESAAGAALAIQAMAHRDNSRISFAGYRQLAACTLRLSHVQKTLPLFCDLLIYVHSRRKVHRLAERTMAAAASRIAAPTIPAQINPAGVTRAVPFILMYLPI